jgi:membrane protein DedA with SNARE-associated domain
MLETLEALIRDYGYYALFVGTFLEGETILLLAGLAAAAGHLNLFFVMVVAFCGSLLGDQTVFFIGRLYGKQFLAKRPWLQPRVEKVHRLMERHHVLLLLGFRFLYGLRNIIPLVIGSSEVKTGRFILLNVIGAITWATSVSLLGYLCGYAVEPLMGKAKIIVLVAVAVVAATVWVVRHLYMRAARRARRAARASQPPTP